MAIISNFTAGLMSACVPASERVTPVVITLTPNTPVSSDRIAVQIQEEAIAPDGTLLSTYRYRWYRDGEESVDLIADSVTSFRTKKGETWEVRVAPTDYPSVVSTAQVVVQNSAPKVVLDFANPSPTTQDDLHVFVTSDDPDGDELTLEYTWLVDRVESTEESAVVAASRTSAGQEWTVSVKATDGDGASTTAEAELLVQNTAPECATVSLSPDPVYTDDVLSASVATSDVDLDAVMVDFQWRVNGQTVQSGVEETLASSYFVKGDYVDVIATPSDGLLTGHPSQSTVRFVQNSLPEVFDVRISPQEPTSADLLTAGADGYFDADGDSVMYDLAWFVNGQLISGATLALSSDNFERGDTVYAVMAGFDGEETGPGSASATVVIENALPTAPEVKIRPVSP